MKFIKHFAALTSLAVCGYGFAAGGAVNVKDLGGSVTLDGKVATEYAMRSMTLGGVAYYGSKGTASKAKDNFDLEGVFGMSYENDKTWARISFRANQEMGSSASGSFISRDGTIKNYALAVQEAYMGFSLFEDQAASLTGTLGREKLSNVYDSKIQFDTRTMHDGLAFRFMNSFENLGDFHATASIWIDSEWQQRFPWAFQAGLSNVMDTGLYLSANYINWEKKQSDTVIDHTRSRNLQFNAGYVFSPDMIGVPVTLYGAYLVNFAAGKNAKSNVNGISYFDATAGSYVSNGMVATGDKKENTAWYAGVSFGELAREGDWMLELRYENVKQNAVLARDAAGIGRYNRLGTNYKGIAGVFKFKITDNLESHVSYYDARHIQDAYASLLQRDSTTSTGEKKFKRVELEAVYNF